MATDSGQGKSGWLASPDSLDPATVLPSTIVVLPLGATEQHGRHLPVETDSLIVKGVCDRLISRLDPASDIRFLPVEAVGYSPEHMDFTDTRSLTSDAAIRRWIELGQAMKSYGVRRFLLLNAHGGNAPLMSIVAQELRVRCSQLAVATSWTRFIKNSGIVTASEEAFGIHGGDIETSAMLALHPDRVDMHQAEDFPNLQEVLALDFTHLRAYGPHAFGWKAADLNATGVTGNAAMATAKKGEALLELAVKGLGELLEDMQKFDLDLLKDT
jgi:creatinine amidohydrolase